MSRSSYGSIRRFCSHHLHKRWYPS